MKPLPQMPPKNEQVSALGWKAFFSLLMVMQAIGLGVMWRTYDAIQEARERSTLTSYEVNKTILPQLADHEGRLKRIEGR